MDAINRKTEWPEFPLSSSHVPDIGNLPGYSGFEWLPILCSNLDIPPQLEHFHVQRVREICHAVRLHFRRATRIEPWSPHTGTRFEREVLLRDAFERE